MAKQLDPEQFEDVKEMMIYEVVLSEALVNLLDKKGLIKKAELLAEIKKIKAKTIEKAKTTEKKKTTVKKKTIGKKK